MSSIQSLDNRYLEFNARTQRVFDQYPQLEPLRVSIFKGLLIGRDGVSATGVIKKWIRPLVRRHRSWGLLQPADVVLFIEGQRDVIVNAIYPVYLELSSRGVKTCLVSLKGPDWLPSDSIRFNYPAAVASPEWAFGSWKMLTSAIDGLEDPSLKRSYYRYCADTSSLLEECSRVLRAVDPKVVLTASNPLDGGVAMALTAQKQGAIAVQLQHGILQPFYTPVIADHFLTWGKTSSETMEALGVKRVKLSIAGSPRHDAMVPSVNGSGRSVFLEVMGLPDRPTLTFFSNGNDLVRNGRAPILCAEWLENLAKKNQDRLNVVVRLHPNEDGSLYRNCPHLRVAKQDTTVAVMLDGSDWIASLCSTVLYEALIFGKSVLQFYADGWPDLADNWKRGLATRVTSSSELDEIVNRFFKSPSNRVGNPGLREQVFANHQKATVAVADFVESRL